MSNKYDEIDADNAVFEPVIGDNVDEHITINRVQFTGMFLVGVIVDPATGWVAVDPVEAQVLAQLERPTYMKSWDRGDWVWVETEGGRELRRQSCLTETTFADPEDAQVARTIVGCLDDEPVMPRTRRWDESDAEFRERLRARIKRDENDE